jgi:hypothetical protein
MKQPCFLKGELEIKRGEPEKFKVPQFSGGFRGILGAPHRTEKCYNN